LRSFLVGFLLLVFLTMTILSLRPGGLRRQLRFAARRFRLALVLGGVYVVATTVVRIAFSEGFIADWGLPLLAIVLAVIFLILGQDPAAPTERERPDPASRS
jgi:hypothetical protein